jgi:transposase-like protein
MNCPSCGRHMSAWSLGPPDHEPAWHCPDCDLTISDEEADEDFDRWLDDEGDE